MDGILRKALRVYFSYNFIIKVFFNVNIYTLFINHEKL